MKKYIELIKLSLINRLDYRQELVMSLFIGVIVFSGQIIFWNAVFGEKETVNGLTYSYILLYYLFARIASEVMDSKVGFRISELIINGSVTNYLLRPVRLQWWLFYHEIGQMSLDIAIKSGIYSMLFLLVFGSLDIIPSHIPLFFLSITMSLLIGFSLFMISGCSAFWTDCATSVNFGLRRMIFFLSGGLVPLVFFPEIVQKLLLYTPFPYIFDLPVRLIMTPVSLRTAATGIGIQLAWAVGLWLIAGSFFRYAVKRNESVGI